MAYQAGTYSSHDDLMTKLFTFLTSGGAGPPGWTQDNFDTASSTHNAAIHKNNIYVSFTWTDSSGYEAIAIYQGLGYSGPGAPWTYTDDSGSGINSWTDTQLTNGRCINPESANGNYWFFEDDDYCHVVVEPSAGIYRHFGFGMLDKVGDWTGGEYAYGTKWAKSGDSNSDSLTSDANSVGFDGYWVDTDSGATVHVEGLAILPSASTKWGVFSNNSGSGGTDRAGVARIKLAGGTRNGIYIKSLAQQSASSFNANKSFLPIGVWAWVDGTPDTFMFLGHQPDCRVVNMAGIAPEAEISDGVDTWVIFPFVRKQYLQVNTIESGNGGLAYKKVTT